MKNLKQFAFYLLAIILLMSCSDNSVKKEEIDSDPWPNGTMYEIFVQSFADSNVMELAISME